MKDFLVDSATVGLLFVLGFVAAITFGTVLTAGFMNVNLGILTYLIYDFLAVAALIGFTTLASYYVENKE